MHKAFRFNNILIGTLVVIVIFQLFNYIKIKKVNVSKEKRLHKILTSNINKNMKSTYKLAHTLGSFVKANFKDTTANDTWKIALLTSETDCQKCVLSMFIELECISKDLGTDKVLLFGAYADENSFVNDIKNYDTENIYSKICITDNLGVNHGPYVFLLSGDYEVCDLINYELFNVVYDEYIKNFNFRIKGATEDDNIPGSCIGRN
ncbi:MAG: hypothetical protein JEZ14_00995 [Marinilabiliaceae bacterium]|nr:hypothetical protein [Marinilabiliaceae bacterium]